jgi:5-methylcytosine-specific restriction protein A
MGDGVDGITGSALAALNDSLGRLRRQVDAVHAQVAARIDRASRPELGNAGLARQQGFRSTAAMIAASTGSHAGDAYRLVSVGAATEPRMTLTGETVPPRHAAIADALGGGRLGVPAAAAIIAFLDKVAFRADHATLLEAEQILVDQAAGLSLDQLQKVLQRAEAWLDPDGVADRESEQRAHRYLRTWTDRFGRIRVDGAFDPEGGAPIVTAIDGIVGTHLRNRNEHPPAEIGARGFGGVPACPVAGVGDCERDDGSNGERQSAVAAGERAPQEDAPVVIDADDRRSLGQLKADALVQLCAHALDCDADDIPTGGATVVVRIDLEDLESGRGFGLIDGIVGPVSVETVRRMAADARVIPCVLDAQGEILDWGRAKRLFSVAQKLALTERDGGCAGCGLPPGMTQVHHIRWWERDSGPTDLDNGILLCIRCHHRIHDDGWEIQIRGSGVRGQVWFIPPAHVDPTRTARRGGRARYDYGRAA